MFNFQMPHHQFVCGFCLPHGTILECQRSDGCAAVPTGKKPSIGNNEPEFGGGLDRTKSEGRSCVPAFAACRKFLAGSPQKTTFTFGWSTPRNIMTSLFHRDKICFVRIEFYDSFGFFFLFVYLRVGFAFICDGKVLGWFLMCLGKWAREGVLNPI